MFKISNLERFSGEVISIQPHLSSTDSKDNERLLISQVMEELAQEMLILDKSQRTVHTYQYAMKVYMRINKVEYIDEINRMGVLNYIGKPTKEGKPASNKTKSNRSKTIRAILNKFHKKGLITVNFWEDLVIKESTQIKEAAKEEDIIKLVNSLNQDVFTEFRDACAITLMWETGIRIGTVSRMTIDMVDLDRGIINLPGYTMKNKKAQQLVITFELAKSLKQLQYYNNQLLALIGKENELLFITENGNSIQGSAANNVISKRLTTYSKKFGLKNINPHSIRRGFATKYLELGVDIVTISKLLNHHDISVTSKYLYISDDEILETMRRINSGFTYK